MMEEHCDRCGDETVCTTMSQFNTDQLCLDCSLKEKKHPDYKKALEAEREAIRNGNHNFKGIGLPEDLK